MPMAAATAAVTRVARRGQAVATTATTSSAAPMQLRMSTRSRSHGDANRPDAYIHSRNRNA
jgi:hypothetical protein